MSPELHQAPIPSERRVLTSRTTLGHPPPTPQIGARPPVTDEQRARAKAALHRRVLMARRSGAACNEYVLRKEADNKPIENAPCHESWHQDIDAHKRLILWAHVESAKTSQITIGRVLFELGRNPNLRVAIVSETDGKAMKVLRAIKTYLRESKELKRVFPHLRRSKHRDDPWNAHAITVNRDTRAKDPSIQVTGVKGSIIGSRVDLLVLDDVLSHRTARTESQREELLAWYKATLGGRLTEHSRVIAVGTAWDKEDLMHTLAKTPGWVSIRYPVIDPETGLPTWPAVWSLKRIAAARIELGPIEAARQLDCQPADGSQSRFDEVSIKRCLTEGRSLCVAQTAAELLGGDELPEGAFFTTGIDVGASLRATGALTVAFTALHYPNGDRQIVCIEPKRCSGPAILALARDHHRRYGSVVFVEDNGAQKFLLQFAAEGEHFPVRAHTTGHNKWHPAFGVESLVIEMNQGRWIFPNDDGVTDPEVAALLADMRKYSPEAHTPDRIMSMWICREGARRSAPGTQPQARVRTYEPVDMEPGEDLDDEGRPWKPYG